MLRYAIKRILALIPILIVVSFLIFFMVRLAPGDPAVNMVGGANTSEEILSNIRAKYHLDKSIPEQYTIWISGVLKGDLGTSYKMNSSVVKLIGERIPITIQLLTMSVFWGVLFSIPIGVMSAVKKNTIVDKLLSVVTSLSISSPVFFTGMVLMLIFAVNLHLLPTYGTGENILENFRYMLLPSLALGVNMVAMNARTLRSSMIQAMESNYVQTAIAKGVSRRSIILKHALKNSWIPFITISGVQVASLLGGTSIIETTFSINGIGSLLINGVNTTDYSVVQGLALVIVIAILLINLLVDIICGLIDTRIQLK
ncbi:MAG: ABC transporter permease [Eubacteriales bacterium]|nr:ABC transporter permease [Eubacteriales bacterium]